MSEPFSVLMSVYRKEEPEFLSEALKSILTQTLIPDEIIIVEDGPLTEELESVLNNYCENNSCIKLLKLKKNVGLGVALNKGLEQCRYEIVARMDSDDISREDRFEVEMKYFEEGHYDLIGCNILEFIDSHIHPVSSREVPEISDDIEKFSKRRNPFNHMTVMFNKKSAVEAGSYVKMDDFEDYYLWLRMLNKKSKTYNVQENLVYARTNQNFLERRSGMDYVKSEYKFQRRILSEDLITNKDFCINILLRCLVRLVPTKILSSLYKNVAHKTVK
ncbi:glycosyltransferase [Latilactobacillus sakei]|uniref:glycosyltransferase n=1 Tax=Latilactobacillus sakei TaxID=1599 RepID=UPI000C128926|nr:glycosyltransferase [Latilactobacillus sakei]MDR7925261.1 glycosyltransferase [Latilactobacillus sakei subsp. sakei]SON73815.1 UDP-Gal:alpha-D-GlcNAc-diphosphoundecaprenol beta-1,3-galactosyltransferase [Latilactobacillus sakei]